MLSLPLRSAPPDESARRRLSRLFTGPATPAARPSPTGPTAPLSPFPPLSPLSTAAETALPGPGAFDPGRPGFRALAVVAAVVVAVAAFLAWQARPQSEPAGQVATAGGSPAPASGTAANPAPAVASASPLVVAVTGRVHRPGLIRLPPGARVADAITAAGGVLPGTDLTTVNLARKVVDGELIAIGVPGLPAAGGPGPAGSEAGGQVNLNTATVAQLDSLPGVGPVLATRIVDYRTRHGAFGSVAELRKVEGIGQAKYEQIKDLVVI